jgi:antitoxin component of RelBE/YafQ-DinJ toxin-antitoxin module
MNTQGARRLLTFRLDQERRQRLKARLARDGRTMSEVVTHGLRQYVQAKLARGDDLPEPPAVLPSPSPSPGGTHPPGPPLGETHPPGPPLGETHLPGPAVAGASRPPVPPRLVLPERIAARLRELRSSGRSEMLSATLAALNEAGWPLRPLAEALGISRQAVQARVRRRAPAELREHVVPCEPPPPFPQRRVASATGLRPHLTIKIDHTLRASAHRAAADEGSSLTQVVEAILDRYLRHGMADEDQARRPASRSR